MKHCNILLEPIAESKDKKKGMKTDKKAVHVERDEERDSEVKMMVRRTWAKEVIKLVMRCFYQNDPTRGRYQKQVIAIWREIGILGITQQRLVGQTRVIRTNEWLRWK